MRLANLGGRAALVSGDGPAAIDLETASNGKFSSSPQNAIERFDEVRSFAEGCSWASAAPLDRRQLAAPSPSPRQIFAIGLNYREHATETGSVLPSQPLVFTKFASCLAPPDAEVEHSGGSMDWEAELVVVMGRVAREVAVSEAWSAVAGVTVGQDISERELQHAGHPPQFSLGKSHPNFGPTGPWLVSRDELSDPDDLEIGCLLNGEQVQKSRTSEMIFPVAELVAHLSRVVTLLPGDLIFTGTPAGVGSGRSPQRFLAVDDKLTTYVQDIGEIHNVVVAGSRRA